MRTIETLFTVALAIGCAALPIGASAQTAINIYALQGLVPVTVLLGTPAGQAALAANYAVTAAIQTGTSNQPGLQPFEQQQQQALKDAFITSANATELADGLGTKLGGAYQTASSYTSADDGKTSTSTDISPSVATLIGYAFALTSADAASGKFFFANETVVTKTGATPVSNDAADILTKAGGTTDVFGKAYKHPAGSPGADPYGNSRPFQTESNVVKYTGLDYFGVASANDAYLNGPTQMLVSSPSFPSGHTTYGYTESLLLAMLLPERFPQMIVRGAEYGNSRIVLGAHYAMDVIAGRTLAAYDIAHLLADNPTYLGQRFGQFSVADFAVALGAARTDLTTVLASGCGNAVPACANEDGSRFRNAAANEAFYESTQTYGLPVVYQATAHGVEDVAAIAPEAGYILTTAYPQLTLAQADTILTQTEGPGGGFLDNGSPFGLYSRLDLYRAGLRAASRATR
ncbi:MAG: phosphatase PAP2 family protein [Candidatus Eremiobacteraeota bacterium]|nr:phosphatase PAP2 family protein [Candidatus Eremiobacteraeota bacterium]